MMKAHIHLECIRTTSFVTVRQLEQEKGVQDSNYRQYRLKKHPEGKQRKHKAHENGKPLQAGVKTSSRKHAQACPLPLIG